jgi:hypothetical protein
MDIQAKEEPGQLMISSSAETGARLYTSWPLIISADLWKKIPVPDDQGQTPALSPITIKAKNDPWREALMLDVKNAAGDSVAWPFHPVKQADESLVLGVDDSAKARWWLDPSETAVLPEGTYTLSVSFNPGLAEGLPTYIVQDRFYLNIEAEPSPLEPVAESAKQYGMADFLLFKDDTKAAGEIVDRLLAKEPESIEVLGLKSKLLMREGKNPEAASVLEDALTVYSSKYPDADPPLGLLHQRSEIFKAMAPEMFQKDGTGPPQ